MATEGVCIGIVFVCVFMMEYESTLYDVCAMGGQIIHIYVIFVCQNLSAEAHTGSGQVRSAPVGLVTNTIGSSELQNHLFVLIAASVHANKLFIALKGADSALTSFYRLYKKRRCAATYFFSTTSQTLMAFASCVQMT